MLPLLLPLALGGCFPPAVTAVSLAADGVSYAATGKTVTDHGLSAARGEDCATIHLFDGRAICVDPKHPVPAAPVEQRVAASRPLPQPAVVAVAAEPGRFVATGSYRYRDNAERERARLAEFRPRIVEVAEAGTTMHRVVLGPLAPSDLAMLTARGVPFRLVPAPEPRLEASAF